MTIAVDLGRKATKQTNSLLPLALWERCVRMLFLILTKILNGMFPVDTLNLICIGQKMGENDNHWDIPLLTAMYRIKFTMIYSIL